MHFNAKEISRNPKLFESKLQINLVNKVMNKLEEDPMIRMTFTKQVHKM